MKRYILENRYQDSGWEYLRQEESRVIAIADAEELAKDSICYGMVRVIDVVSGTVVVVVPAGGF